MTTLLEAPCRPDTHRRIIGQLPFPQLDLEKWSARKQEIDALSCEEGNHRGEDVTAGSQDARTEPVSRGTSAPTLEQIERALRDSWGSDTCDAHDVDHWTPEHPSTGQCAATAYVVNDYLGGQLLGAEVRNPDGSLQGHHYWNLIDGVEVDLTLEQFVNGEVVEQPDVMDRIHPRPEPGAERYLILRARVAEHLARGNTPR